MRKANTANFNCLVRLTCNHVIVFALPGPAVDETVWCRRCELYRNVYEKPMEYSWRCNECRGSRQYGGAKLGAQRAADRHTAKYPGHVVTVYLGNEVLEVRTPRTVTEPLPFGVDEPPPF